MEMSRILKTEAEGDLTSEISRNCEESNSCSRHTSLFTVSNFEKNAQYLSLL